MSRTRSATLFILAFVALATAASFAATGKPEPAPKAQVAQPQDDENDWDERGDSDDRGWSERDGRGGFEGHGRGGHRAHHGGHRGHRGGMGGHRMAFRAAKDPSASVMHDLASLERMYQRNGKAEEVPGLYRDVLARTNDPAVRHMAGSRLARLEWQAGNKDAAIELMRKNLDADLKRLK